ncbi:multiple sugar transport system permease protein [Paenibacillus sp. UNCCL117]|uniref:carbohydrate ABC transporter permease n=1 Tax=unclassified Paenibacillus TaxID=185978 RepID=UPI0008852837|nr:MULTISPECIES: sugar ABC transporter permease [unclassified Paenibacillus]SDD96281.1 carbohydrate ABC transporter membrane protein 1, CUT1 family [Paenibacillus sp. cl123]SFW56423.1 multiple sugar transport system permease protein [Paenibacillus sp. UNCCL117]
MTDRALPKAERAVSGSAPRRIRMELTNYMFVIPGGAFVLIFLIFPIFYNIWNSFQDVTLMNLKGGHHFVGWQNYSRVFADPLFKSSVSNSLYFTAGSLVFQFVLGFALALFFHRRFPGRDLMRSLILLGWMMPIVITGTLFKWILSGDSGVFNHLLSVLGLIDQPVFWLTNQDTALAAATIANVWIGIPFNMLILLAGLQALPEQLYEAAKIDGAGRLRQFTQITIPLMRPTIFIVLMLVLIYTFKVFDLIYVMTGGGPVNVTTVLPLFAYKLAFNNYEISMGSTVASLMFVFLIALASVYLWMSRKEEKS